MGDSRMNVKIEFEVYGKKTTVELGGSWRSDDRYGGMDKSVAQWFMEAVEEARFEYFDDPGIPAAYKTTKETDEQAD